MASAEIKKASAAIKRDLNEGDRVQYVVVGECTQIIFETDKDGVRHRRHVIDPHFAYEIEGSLPDDPTRTEATTPPPAKDGDPDLQWD